MKSEIEQIMENRVQGERKIIIEEFVKNNTLYHKTKKLLSSYRPIKKSIHNDMELIKCHFSIHFEEGIDRFLHAMHTSCLDIADEKGILELENSMKYKRNRLLMVEEAAKTIRFSCDDGEKMYYILHYNYFTVEKIPAVNLPNVVSEEFHKNHPGDNITQKQYYELLKEALWYMHMFLWGQDLEM